MAQLLRYGIVGGASVFVYIGLLATLVHLIPQHSVLANAAAYTIATAVNYLLNYYWSFTAKRPHAQTSWRFLSIVVAGVILNSFYVAAMSRWTELPLELIGLSFALAWPIISFACLRFWVFR
ncbi:GtrA family protein [Chelativorans sp. J32]|uniref:GtrA family protein n=1 Tax=Chelativorans sp. J32 TaxID=935840 RepID=UPI0018DDF72A